MIAFTGGKILTMDGRTLDSGTICVEDGKIVSVAEGKAAPEGARVVDITGKVVTPGLIDAHTHMGVHSEGLVWSSEDYNERCNPVTGQVDVLDGFYPFDIGLLESLSGGVTTAMIAPGSANPIGGRCMIVKTRANADVERMVLKRDAGLKIAFGENPRRNYGNEKKSPVTRMGIAAVIREALQRAKEYMAAREKDAARPIDFSLETIAKVLRREMPLRAHAHRVDDILTAIRIAKEFDVKIIIEHATEGHLIADRLAAEKIPVVSGPLFKTRAKMEINERSWLAPGIFERAGVKFSLISDHPVVPCRFMTVYAALAVRFGLSREAALRAMTIDAAQIMGIDDRVGSIAPGKDADFVVWSGDPLDILTRPEKIVVDGAIGSVDMAAGQKITHWE